MRERLWVRARGGEPRSGPGARPPAAVRTQRPPPPRAGKDLRVVVRVSGRRNLPALHESGDSRPGATLDGPDLRPASHLPSPGRVAELWGGALVLAEPKPSLCHAQRGFTFSPLIPPPLLSLRESRMLCSPVGCLWRHPSDPRRRPQHPKLKEKRVSPPALVGGCPEVPNFSPNRRR